jgi:UDP-N-acetylmuramate: L-alanyl-gamma-D-glutamyl-meso-diaminopimelate ligase
MDPNELVQELGRDGVEAHYIPVVDDIVRHLLRELEGGEVVLIMSNGSFGGIHGKLLGALG